MGKKCNVEVSPTKTHKNGKIVFRKFAASLDEQNYLSGPQNYALSLVKVGDQHLVQPPGRSSFSNSLRIITRMDLIRKFQV